MKPNDGGLAFPVQFDATRRAPGMTLRQWYAGQAVKGMLSNPNYIYIPEKVADDPNERFSARAFQVADAMIAFEEAEKEDA